MNLLIERIGIRREAMWGVLCLHDAEADEWRDFAYTGELASNRIPAGLYELRRDHTGRFQWWRMYGHGVNDGVAGLEDVEFHAMAHPRIDSKACIGIGMMLGMVVHPRVGGPAEQGLWDSRVALNKLLHTLGEGDHVLEIKEPVE